VFYLVCGVVAALTHVVFNSTSRVPTIGASGAISGVLGAYFILYPRARVITLIPLFILPWFVEIPAVVYLGFWFLSQLFNGALSVVSNAQPIGGVAFWAHIGGFLAGVLLIRLFEQRRYIRRRYVDEYWPW
jgi:membrane associated rhomboid family serine protease